MPQGATFSRIGPSSASVSDPEIPAPRIRVNGGSRREVSGDMGGMSRRIERVVRPVPVITEGSFPLSRVPGFSTGHVVQMA